MPELDVKASITLLATSASTAIFLTIMLSAILIGPALSWVGTMSNKAIKSFMYDESAEFLRRGAIIWFMVPLASYGVAIVLMIIAWYRWGEISFRVGFAVSLSLILVITGWCFWRRLPNCLTSRDKREAMISLLGSTLLSMLMLVPLLLLVRLTIGTDRTYDAHQTLWIVVVMCVGLIFNAVVVRATSFPVGKSLLIIISLIFIFHLYFPFAKPVPKMTMSWFKFGNIQHASLILDEVGCNISRSHRLSVEKRVPDPKTCVLPDVMILSRLGTPYYIQVAGTPQTRSTIPAQNILSWSVIEPKNTAPTEAPQNP